MDNNISGNIQVLEGEAIYNLGTNSGLEFYYVDDDVTNGKMYYYAIVAYDRGIASSGGADPGIDPQENTFRVELSGAGTVVGTSINTAAVIPTTNPVGYISGGTDSDLSKVTEGSGTGSASINIAVEELIDDTKLYEVSFSDSAADIGVQRVTTRYEVREVGSEALIPSSPYSSSSSIVDGFIINFMNDTPGNIISNKTGWISNEGGENELFGLDASTLDGLTTDWSLAITPDKDSDLTNYLRTDHDYEILFVNPEDSTYRPPLLFGMGFSRFDVPMFAKNLMTGEQADIFILDNDDNDQVNAGDRFFIAEKDESNRVKYRFTIDILSSSGDVAPSPGEKIRISTTRPFGSDDKFRFTMRKQSIDNEQAKESLEDIFVAPNPYLGAASWERASGSIGRGERKIEFFNLPLECTIRIFNVRGELVRTIEHEGSMEDGSASWDLRSNDSEDIAYGIYFYHVEAPGVGEYIDKFAIIK